MLDSTTSVDHKKTVDKKFAWAGHLNAILAQKVGNMNEPIFKTSNAQRGGGGGGSGGMMKPQIDLRTIKTDERCTGRDFYTNCIFSWLLGEKRRTRRGLGKKVCDFVCIWVTRKICTHVVQSESRQEECHYIGEEICNLVCTWVTRGV